MSGNERLDLLPNEQARNDDTCSGKNEPCDQRIDFQQIQHDLPPLAAQQTHSGVGNQRDSGSQQHS